MRQIFLGLLVAATLPLHFAHAEETRLTYPELEVTPRASERLKIEADRERTNRWFVNFPVQASALMTILASNQADVKDDATADEKSEYDDRKQRALYVGAGWFILSGVLSATYHPYRSGLNDLRGLPAGTQREQLVRERLAEEALYRPATVANTMKWLSAASELFVTLSLTKNGTDRARAFAGVAAMAALAPFIFEHKWSSVAKNHKMYKKKIYGPLSGPILMPEEDGQFAFGYGLQMSF